MTDQEFRKAVQSAPDFELVIPCYQYLKTVCAEYGEEGKVAIKLIEIVEGIIK